VDLNTWTFSGVHVVLLTILRYRLIVVAVVT